MKTTTLSNRRLADRIKMAKILEELIVRCGATSTREDFEGAVKPHPIWLKVEAPGGLIVTVELDGTMPEPDMHLLAWNIAYGSKAKLNNSTFGGDVNPCHFQKATYIAYGFEELCEQLEKGLLMAKDGSAYLPEVAPEAVAA
jgi:hypothetical protein